MYEVTLFSAGLFQIGWSTLSTSYTSEVGLVRSIFLDGPILILDGRTGWGTRLILMRMMGNDNANGIVRKKRMEK